MSEQHDHTTDHLHPAASHGGAHHPHAHPLVMYDSVTVGAIPRDAEIVAAYVAGDPYPNVPAVKARCPHAKIVTVALYHSLEADCLDMEPGGAALGEFPSWCHAQHKRGIQRPIGYTSASQLQALHDIAARAGLEHGKDWRAWSAHYTYHQHRCGPACGYGIRFHAEGTQWTNRSHGLNLDESLVGFNFAAH